MIDSTPTLFIVIPCYNESKVLPNTSIIFLNNLMDMISSGIINDKSKIVYVNDGSCDDSWSLIKSYCLDNTHIGGISLSRNMGHQNALIAGLMESIDKCDITISIDCDGQDDVSIMKNMVSEYCNGNDIVYGVRNCRDTDSFFKRFTAEFYYKLLQCLGCDIVYNHADYRLISNRALKELANFTEVNLFLRGIVPLLGFESSTVEYKREKRIAGDSHYSFSKMINLGMDGVTSLSVRPLRFIAVIGLLFSVISFIGIIWAIVEMIIGNTVPGWASTICIICFFSSIQLIGLGILGEYIGKIYLETKQRPRYIISEKISM